MQDLIKQRIGFMLTIWVIPFSSAFSNSCADWAAKITSLQGDIEIRRNHGSAWQLARLDDVFCAGDVIRTGNNSRATLVLPDDTLLRLNQNAAIKLIQHDPKRPSILEFIRGIGHFISRIPRSLKVETPTVNAAVEGTEFVVAINDNETQITVFEGTVLTYNRQGETRITDGETAIAKANTAPVKTLLARPRDVVQWALYFPPIISKDRPDILSRASKLLYEGQPSKALSLIDKDSSGEALALKSIIAIVRSDKNRAMDLVERAQVLSPDSAAVHLASSYVWQAKLNLTRSLESARLAVVKEPENAIAWARLAELQLSTGHLEEALSSANQAIQIDASLSRTQSILGFSHLVRIDVDEAISAFNKAIRLDQVDPFPRLGLGLSKIRQNKLKEGRREIEIAASLDPNNAIIRSYLGKAYYEERRGPLDAVQFAMAKMLDAQDPTPYYYDAIRKHSNNNTSGALEDLSRSIELNNNRAVYRSSLQLDQDIAARNVSLAKIYHDLGFRKRALIEGWKSVNTDPGNYSAHRFIADSYLQFSDRNIARVSELMQAQLLQPISLNPVQTQIGQTDPVILQGTGPVDASLNEYAPLFVSDGTVLQLSSVIGTNNTWGDDLAVTGINGNLLYSVGQFHYETDGFRINNDLIQDSSRAFMQYALSHRSSFQFEYNKRDSQEGDLALNVLGFSDTERIDSNKDSLRAGFHYQHSASSDVLISAIMQEQYEEHLFFPGFELVFDGESSIIEAQYIYNTQALKLIIGAGHLDDDNEITIAGFPGSSTTGGVHDNAYIYSSFNCASGVSCTLGLNADRYDSENINLDTDQVNPKFGIFWDVTDSTVFRFAAFRNLNRLLPTDQTLEPTQVAGFNQFFDDNIATDSKSVGLGIDQQLNKYAFWGLEGTYRKLILPDLTKPSAIGEWQETNYHAYFYKVLTSTLSVGFEYSFERFENDIVAFDSINKIKHHEIPVFLRYNSTAGFFSQIQLRYVDQESISENAAQREYEDSFMLVDTLFGYKIPGGYGTLSIDVRNMFDKEFIYQDDSFRRVGSESSRNPPRFLPDRTAFLKFSLQF